DRAHAIARREPRTLVEQGLVVSDLVRRPQHGGRTGRFVDELARVGHLAAALGVERRLAQLAEEGAVAEVLQRADLRQRLGLRVADELRLEAGALRELDRSL